MARRKSQEPEPDEGGLLPYHAPEQEDDPLALRLESMADDAAKLILDLLKQSDVPWSLRTERAQRDTIHEVERFSERLVRTMFGLFRAAELPTCDAVLGEVKIKGEKGIEAKISCLNNQHNRSVLGVHVGRTFIAILADPEMFMQAGGRLNPIPDQSDMDV